MRTLRIYSLNFYVMYSCVNDIYYIPSTLHGEGNGTPPQYSCPENPTEEEPGGLQTMGLLRVGNAWATSLSLFTFMHWRRKWQPTPVFLPGESQGWGSLVGCVVAQSWTRLKWLSSSSKYITTLLRITGSVYLLTSPNPPSPHLCLW